MRSFRLLWGVVTVAILLCLQDPTRSEASAEFNYNVANYHAMADADSGKAIPPGTKITLQNWQKYRKFMALSLQAAYSGQYKWHVGPGPEYTIEVGPTQHYPLVHQFVEDTER